MRASLRVDRIVGSVTIKHFALARRACRFAHRLFRRAGTATGDRAGIELDPVRGA
jgi:hypothetical protein